MTRKTKIRIAGAGVVLGLLAWAFGLGQDRAELKVTLAGGSSNDSSVVWFTITNTSRTPLIYIQTAQEHQAGRWVDLDFQDWRWADERVVKSELPGHGATNCLRSVPYLHPWRLAVAYKTPQRDSRVFKARHALAQYASRHHWPVVARWLRPVTRWKISCGPEMIAERPAPTAGP